MSMEKKRVDLTSLVNALTLFEKTTRKDHLKMTVEGMKHDRKILVEKLTEAE
ncbi:MAG: hypothetical protein ACREEM_52585 [Blastocatellia bacterium]